MPSQVSKHPPISAGPIGIGNDPFTPFLHPNSFKLYTYHPVNYKHTMKPWLSLEISIAEPFTKGY